MEKLHKSWMVLFAAMFLGLVSHFAYATKQPPKAIAGVLDLRDWDFEQDGRVNLDGEWAFYWQQLLTPEHFAKSPAPEKSAYLSVPSTFRDSKVDGELLPTHGYATYRLKVLLDGQVPRLRFRIREIEGASKFYVNGGILASAGTVAIEPSGMEPQLLKGLYGYLPDSQSIDIIVQVSNFHTLFGGIRHPIVLGVEEALRKDELAFNLSYFLSGSFLIMGLYHLIFYFTRRSDPSPLYFSFICFNMSLRMLVYDKGELWISLFPNSPFLMAFRLELITIYIAPALFSLFIYSLFPRFFAKAVLYLIVAICAGFSLYVIFAPIDKFWFGVWFFQVLYLPTFAYIGYVLIKSAMDQQEGAKTFILGSLIFFLTLINDGLVGFSIIEAYRISPIGLFLFIFSQAFIVSRRFANSLVRSERLVTSYERFVPQEFLNQLGKKEIMEVQLGDCVRAEQMSILFSDIRSFTSLSETMTPQQNFDFLNTYLKRMEPAITENNGVIDKYIGDAVMAIFPIDADDSVCAAIGMQQKLAEFNVWREQHNLIPIQIGIGVNTGDMMLGTIGAENRMEGTVISDAVNLAARLEGMTKMYSARILVSENTVNGLKSPHEFDLRVADKVIVKGKSEPVTVWEVFSGDPPEIKAAKRATLSDFESAIECYYQKQFETASGLFQQCLDTFKEDKIASIYLTRCQHYIEHGYEEDWDGVERLETK